MLASAPASDKTEASDGSDYLTVRSATDATSTPSAKEAEVS